MFRSSNPALSERAFSSQAIGFTTSEDTMTVEGAVQKSFIAILITIVSAYWAWNQPSISAYILPLALGAFAVAMAVTFKPAWAPIATPIYAVAEGALLGAISHFVSAMIEAKSPGNGNIVFQAISLTFGTLLCLLVAYQSGMVKATSGFRKGVVAATGAICLLYVANMLLSLFGVSVPFIHGSGLISIGFSVVVVTVAALNLVLDFDFIESAGKSGDFPKHMEWYAAFGLLVTLVWLYIEILNLLLKLRDRN